MNLKGCLLENTNTVYTSFAVISFVIKHGRGSFLHNFIGNKLTQHDVIPSHLGPFMMVCTNWNLGSVEGQKYFQSVCNLKSEGFVSANVIIEWVLVLIVYVCMWRIKAHWLIKVIVIALMSTCVTLCPPSRWRPQGCLSWRFMRSAPLAVSAGGLATATSSSESAWSTQRTSFLRTLRAPTGRARPACWGRSTVPSPTAPPSVYPFTSSGR